MSRVRAAPKVQLIPGAGPSDYPARGHLCVLAYQRKPYGPGTWHLDRIASVGPKGKVLAVESGREFVQGNQPDSWQPPWPRHGRTYTFVGSGWSAIRAADAWAAYLAAGSPTFRSATALVAWLATYGIAKEGR